MKERTIEDIELDLARVKKQLKQANDKDFTKIVLLVIYLTTILIVIAYFYCIIVVQVEPVAIIEWYFKTVIGEVGVLGIIKVVKTVFKKEDKK